MFINIEGIDGSGKTTLVNNLKNTFPDFYYTREPTDGFDYAGLVPLENEYNSILDFFLFTYDRIRHQKEIKENIKNIVISDRYIASSIAYEGPLIERFFSGIDETIQYLMDVSRPVKCMPDVIIYLDVKIDTALKRIINNRKVLKYRDEKLSVLEKKNVLGFVSTYYLYFLKNIKKFTGTDIKVEYVDANRPENMVLNDTIKIIEKLL
ncbi:dTMP kinase [Acidiplasma sp.]|uniref:dTMP kinase n=1 Tax=Acidiplasma sp. TaxID=1872114 RepID=UPI00258D6814|nr:dTMP kinase [Acidiplasma sp.]